MKDIIDLHTHTIASGHAYNTMNEMIEAAVKKNIEILGITEHAPAIPGTCSAMYFMNFRALKRERMGIKVLYGAELNIIDLDGSVDLPDLTLKEMDLTIASLHPPCMPFGSEKDNTKAYVNVMKNPYINIIGHPDDARYPVNYDEIVKAAKEYHVLLEMNNASLSPMSFRGNPVDKYKKMLDLCVKHEVPVIVNSDAHVDLEVGNHTYALNLIKEVNFPEKLLVNSNTLLLNEYINYYK